MVHPLKIVDEIKNKPANNDIMDLIKERFNKKIQPQKFEYLTPTVANLYGL